MATLSLGGRSRRGLGVGERLIGAVHGRVMGRFDNVVFADFGCRGGRCCRRRRCSCRRCSIRRGRGILDDGRGGEVAAVARRNGRRSDGRVSRLCVPFVLVLLFALLSRVVLLVAVLVVVLLVAIFVVVFLVTTALLVAAILLGLVQLLAVVRRMMRVLLAGGFLVVVRVVVMLARVFGFFHFGGRSEHG